MPEDDAKKCVLCGYGTTLGIVEGRIVCLKCRNPSGRKALQGLGPKPVKA